MRAKKKKKMDLGSISLLGAKVTLSRLHVNSTATFGDRLFRGKTP